MDTLRHCYQRVEVRGIAISSVVVVVVRRWRRWQVVTKSKDEHKENYLDSSVAHGQRID